MSAPQLPTPVAVFCAFAQPDVSSCLKLEEALKPAQRQRVLMLWHEGHIPRCHEYRSEVQMLDI